MQVRKAHLSVFFFFIFISFPEKQIDFLHIWLLFFNFYLDVDQTASYMYLIFLQNMAPNAH